MIKMMKKAYLMEFIGAFFFILTVALGVHPLAIASMLMAWLYIGGHVSGAHYNPMISLAIMLRGKLARHEFIPYAIAQILGGLSAYLFAAYIHTGVIIPAPAQGVTLLQAGVIEVMLSFVFASIVLVVATSEQFKNSNIFGFAIGFTVPALLAFGSPLSGGLFNPAIALGSSLAGIIHGIPVIWEHLLMYLGGAGVGGFLAAKAFSYFE